MRALAVDAGGTYCRVALISTDGYKVVVTASANASTDIKATATSIISGLDKLSQKVGITANELARLPTYLGVAGVIEPQVALTLRKYLPFDTAKIEDDRLCALHGALADTDGFIAHCGTGSFYATQKNSKVAVAGGWGPMLDDLASAYWIGVQALQFTLCAKDGLERHTGLTKNIASGFRSAAAIVSFAKNADNREVASLAKKVTRYAEANDMAAIGMLKRGAAIVEQKLRQFGWKQSDAVCLTGGIAMHYEPYLPRDLQVCVADPKGEPIDGAVALAKAFYKEVHG